eukprot:7241239-Pyramimonas_sp.AAC.1
MSWSNSTSDSLSHRLCVLGFNVHSWRAKCKCGAPHDQHDPVTRGGPCPSFVSNYMCIVCDSHQEEHDTVYESAAERTRAGRAVGKDFLPLAETPELQELVLGKGRPKGAHRSIKSVHECFIQSVAALALHGRRPSSPT